MKTVYAKDAPGLNGQMIETLFLVASKQVRFKKNREPYLALTLMDRTGTIEAKVWNNVEEVKDAFDENDFVRVSGRVQRYNDRHELVIDRLERVTGDEIDPADFFPRTSYDIDRLWHIIEVAVGSVTDTHVRLLLQSFLADEDIAKRLRVAPAAKFFHHAYQGGLLEHIASLCTLGDIITTRYFWVNRDLLIAAAVLHDIGKIYELSYGRAFGYTLQGNLVGHIAIGLTLLEEKIRAIREFPETLQVLLEHLILSHHGTLEHGSPVEPRFPEAVLFHHLDDLDSKMEAVHAALGASACLPELWSARVPSLGCQILDSEKFLNSTQAHRESQPTRTDKPAKIRFDRFKNEGA
jgi:3'-5' exoribonuclease